MAAKLASSFGVYGTIAGAGLISVVATCGGSVLQHFFKRTGEQIRVKRTVAAVRIDGRTASVPAATPDPNPASASGDFTEGTVYRTRTRGWRRPLVAAALVFGVTMAGITVYEVASGQNLSGGHSTTVGSAFTGHGKSAADSGSPGSPATPVARKTPRTAGTPATRATRTTPVPGAKPWPPPSGSPDATDGSPSSGAGSTEGGGTESSPTPTRDAGGDEEAGGTGAPDPDASATAPEPGASSRSGTGGQGQDGPAAP